jgi:hypothetical protein
MVGEVSAIETRSAHKSVANEILFLPAAYEVESRSGKKCTSIQKLRRPEGKTNV